MCCAEEAVWALWWPGAPWTQSPPSSRTPSWTPPRLEPDAWGSRGEGQPALQVTMAACVAVGETATDSSVLRGPGLSLLVLHAALL